MLVISWLLAAVAAVMYLKSGLQKLRNPYALQLVMSGYVSVPFRWIQTAAPIIITSEILTAVWLLVPFTRQVGVYAGIGLQLLFIILLTKNFGKTMEYGCGCFGLNQPQTIEGKHLYVNGMILTVLILLATLM
ncbi:methylamine utilization protein MauE [Paenibacillus cellulosilyticus]|uniref:Methylamine utilization protein MauE n=2 Tax=Paenibacillus cellulosilyticus TaxID=375489 RepID=A0A2V2YN63_9BACL|nr:methylamine utilization protein MauE [Paenibacillus cellulosilyticus]